MKTKFKFVIEYKDQNIELTVEEAEKLYNDLKKIFGKEYNEQDLIDKIRDIKYPENPWTPNNPINPNPNDWDGPTIPTTNPFPYKPIIWYCSLNEQKR